MSTPEENKTATRHINDGSRRIGRMWSAWAGSCSGLGLGVGLELGRSPRGEDKPPVPELRTSSRRPGNPLREFAIGGGVRHAGIRVGRKRVLETTAPVPDMGRAIASSAVRVRVPTPPYTGHFAPPSRYQGEPAPCPYSYEENANPAPSLPPD